MTPALPLVVPDDPADRPWTRRKGARVIIIDERGQVLLFCDTDPGFPGRRWWVTPGGGLDPGESEIQAAVREVAEETGLRLSEAELAGPIARRRVRHGFSDRVLDQTEVFFLARVSGFTPDTSDFTESERQTLVEHRWWSPVALAETGEWIWPKELLTLVESIDRPSVWPLELRMTDEESTRAVVDESG